MSFFGGKNSFLRKPLGDSGGKNSVLVKPFGKNNDISKGFTNLLGSNENWAGKNSVLRKPFGKNNDISEGFTNMLGRRPEDAIPAIVAAIAAYFTFGASTGVTAGAGAAGSAAGGGGAAAGGGYLGTSTAFAGASTGTAAAGSGYLGASTAFASGATTTGVGVGTAAAGSSYLGASTSFSSGAASTTGITSASQLGLSGNSYLTGTATDAYAYKAGTLGAETSFASGAGSSNSGAFLSAAKDFGISSLKTIGGAYVTAAAMGAGKQPQISGDYPGGLVNAMPWFGDQPSQSGVESVGSSVNTLLPIIALGGLLFLGVSAFKKA